MVWETYVGYRDEIMVLKIQDLWKKVGLDQELGNHKEWEREDLGD